MRKTISLILLGLVCSVGNVWGATTFSFEGKSGYDTPTGTGVTRDGITLVISGGTHSNSDNGYWNISGQNTTISISSTSTNITGITLNCTASNRVGAFSVTTGSGSYSVSDKVGTYSNSSAENNVVLNATTAGARINTIVVTTSGGGGGGTKYTLAWDSNGGSTLSGDYSTGSITSGDAISAPNDPTKANYTFDGWKTNNDGTGTTASATMPAANTTYNAAWKQTVTLNTGLQGDGANKTPYVYLNGTALSDDAVHSASGWTLLGYYTATTDGTKVLNADGSFAGANVADYITNGKWSRTGSAPTLYAQWSEVVEWVIFDGSVDDAIHTSPIIVNGVSLVFSVTVNRVDDKSEATNNTGNGKSYLKGLRISKANDLSFTIPTGYTGTFRYAFSGTGKRTIRLGSKAAVQSDEADGFISKLTDVTNGPIDGGNYSTPLSAGTYYICENNSGNWQIVDLSFTLTPTSVSKSITAAGWATYCSPYALDLKNATGLTDAYIVTGGTNGILVKTSVKGGTVPANTGLLLKGPEGSAVIPTVASSSTEVGDNILKGVTVNTSIEAGSGWVLMNDGSHGLGFYQNASAFTVGANTAYILVNELPVPTPSSDAPARFLLEEEEHNATDIQSIEGNVEVVKFIENGQLLIKRDNVVYDTMGRIVR